MVDDNWLADQFEARRGHLRAVAFRMLGSLSEADDAVQESWLRLTRAGPSGVENLGGWLTTVVARICLDMLRPRRSRREQPIGLHGIEPDARRDAVSGPEEQALLADAVGVAMLVVLDTLAPAERLAFVLHDIFGVPFDEIAPLVDRSAAAARQLASRARRRVQRRAASDATAADPNLSRQRRVVDAFLAASRAGDFGALVELLDPDVVLRSDPAAVAIGSLPELRGAAAVARTFVGRAQTARTALVEGSVGLVWIVRGRPRVAFALSFAGETIVAIELFAAPERLARPDLVVIESS